MADAPAAVATETAEAAASSPPVDRAREAVEKGKALAAAAKSADAGGEEPDKGTDAADETETEGAETEATETEQAEAGEKPEGEEEKPEPKTARAKQWAAINRVKQAQATKARELARAEQAIRQERAELSKVQHELLEMNRMFREEPDKFVERLSSRPGGLRDLFERAVQQEKRTPEQEKEAARDRELEELKAWKKQQEESVERWKREQEQQAAAQKERQQHEENYAFTQQTISGLVKEGGYPNIAALVRTSYGLRNVSTDVYNRILTEWDGGKGRERPIPEVLDVIETELAKEAGSGLPQASPPARANGAGTTANPEAKPKRTPPTMTNAQASARASGGRELKGDERIKHFASLLRTRPD